MKLKEMNLSQRVYGDVPPSFQHRVEYTLRQVKEESSMKRFTLRTFALVAALVAIAGIACAAMLSNTADFFGQYHGDAWRDAALQGDIDSSKPAIQVGDLIYTMDDVIVTGISLGNGADESAEPGMTVYDDKCAYILATGTIRPAEGANVIIIPEDHLLSDPWNASPHYHNTQDVAEGTPTVLEKATELGAKILCARTTANGLMDVNGALISCDIGYDGILQEDGSLLFAMEIQLAEPIERQDAYTLSVYVSNHEVDAEGNHLMDTRQAEDWLFTITPTAAAN